MKRKIGIVSLYGLYNYGNRLQSYAVCELIKGLGFQPIVFDIQDNISYSIKLFLKHINNLRIKNYRKKYSRFKEFIMGQPIKKVIFCSRLPRIGEDYSFFVVGSDQIWHPNSDLRSDAKFLAFVPREKRIALAPSFGVSELDENLFSSYRTGLLGFDILSVREIEGQQIISTLTKQPSYLLMDPTVGITKEEWLRVSSNKFCPKEPYLLCYFLNGASADEKVRIKEYAEEHDLIVLDALEGPYGPQDFLGLINNSYAVFSNSFHATIFSLIFEKKVYLFNKSEKQSTTSRLHTVVSRFSLPEQVFSQGAEDYEICWPKINHVLAEERIKLLDYLTRQTQ